MPSPAGGATFMDFRAGGVEAPTLAVHNRYEDAGRAASYRGTTATPYAASQHLPAAIGYDRQAVVAASAIGGGHPATTTPGQ